MKHFCLLLVLTFVAAACTPEKEERRVRLTLKERERVDKLVGAHMDSIRPILDSLCAVASYDRVTAATDSIVQRRLEEEARLRSRIPQNLRDGK